MRKFIHSNFEIDLSKLKVSDVLENPWFSNKFFVKFTFPFEVDLTEENDINFGFLSHYNAYSHTTLYEGFYVHRENMEQAILEIEEVTDKISMNFGYGYDEFPNFNKKLSELPLDKFNVTDIYAHAATIISQTWPSVNYNFPQIHIDKIDNTEDPWLDFENIINNYKNGAFLVNEVIENDTFNRNIIQPTPYALHIIKKGFEDAGKVLKGDILEDPTIQKLCIYTDTSYWTTLEQESYSIFKMSSDYVETGTTTVNGVYPGSFSWANTVINPSFEYQKYYQQIDISNPGKYRVVGKVKLVPPRYGNGYIKFNYRNQTIYYHEFRFRFGLLTYDVNVDFILETLSDGQNDTFSIEIFNGISSDKVIIDLNINPIRLHDDQGNAVPNIINKNSVDLTRAVPDMTFGEFIEIMKNWFNLDLKISGNDIYMNFIELEKKRLEVIDLTSFEVKNPIRKFSRGNSFLLKFEKVETKDYIYLPVFLNSQGILSENFKTDEKTNEIIINALPLPLTTRNQIQTVHAFETDSSKIFGIIYDGLNQDSLNLAKDNYELLIPQIFDKHYKQWLDFRLNSQGFQWSFKAHYEDIFSLTNKSRIHAYKNNHIVKSLTRTEVAEDEFEIDIETYAEL